MDSGNLSYTPLSISWSLEIIVTNENNTERDMWKSYLNLGGEKHHKINLWYEELYRNPILRKYHMQKLQQFHLKSNAATSNYRNLKKNVKPYLQIWLGFEFVKRILEV